MALSDFIIEEGILKKYVGNETNIIIPNGVIEIGVRAFNTKEQIISISISSTVKTIRSFAFSNCRNLQSITFPESVEFIEDRIFSGCKNIDSITITNQNTDINKFAFNNCIIKNINIPESINLKNHEIDISTTINNKRQVGKAVGKTIAILIELIIKIALVIVLFFILAYFSRHSHRFPIIPFIFGIGIIFSFWFSTK